MAHRTVVVPEDRTFEDRREQLLEELVWTGTFRFGGPFKLRGGNQSDFYANIRVKKHKGPINDDLLRLTTGVLAQFVEEAINVEFTMLAPVPRAAVPFGEALANALKPTFGHPPRLVYVEKEEDAITAIREVPFLSRFDKILPLENVTTTGGSCGRVVDLLGALAPGQAIVRDVVTMLDREEGAREYFASRGIRLHALFTKSEVMEYCRAHPLIAPDARIEPNPLSQEVSV